MNVFIHVGVQKTGTTYLQKVTFPKLDSQKVIYNPKELLSLIIDCLLWDASDANVMKARKETRTFIEKFSRTHEAIIISLELISGRYIYLYDNIEKNYGIIKEIFEDPQIILNFRFQPNWIASAYKQSLSTGFCHSFEEFIGLKEAPRGIGAGEKKEIIDHDVWGHTISALRKKNGKNYKVKPKEIGYKIKINAKVLDWSNCLRTANNIFGQKNVHVFYYENLFKRKKEICSDIFNLIGSAPIGDTSSLRINRGYSAFLCDLTVKIGSIFPQVIGRDEVKISKKLYLRPKNYDAPFSDAIKKENVFKILYLLFAKIINRIIFFVFGNVQIKSPYIYIAENIFDRIIYWNWDLLEKAGVRDELVQHYMEKNNELKEIANSGDVPEFYHKAPHG